MLVILFKKDIYVNKIRYTLKSIFLKTTKSTSSPISSARFSARNLTLKIQLFLDEYKLFKKLKILKKYGKNENFN